MSSSILLLLIIAYFLLLLFVSWRTGKGSNNESFFIGNRNSNWMLVAFGMIGTSLSGVTFVSVPGAVKANGWSYMQITLGYMLGYISIAYVLLPLYYRLKLTSIYDYLRSRLGFTSYKTGALFFIISRLAGATARLYLVVNILQNTIFNHLSFHIPFGVTTLIILAMIIIYTFEGGVKTIVWTDTLQTSGMLLGLIICTIFLLHHLDLNLFSGYQAMQAQGLSNIFNTDPLSKGFFVKQILAGMFITLTMTGIDQEMMQKSISVSSLKDSQKNMLSLSIIMVIVIGLFLYLGGLLYLYSAKEGIATNGDSLFPEIALNHMTPAISIIFIIALISALFPSADGAMTALTSSLCIDILGMNRRTDWDEKKKKRIRQTIHIGVAISFLIMVLIFKAINNPSMINIILVLAGYTYGPLLGLFSFGILTKRAVKDKWVPIICLVAPTICYFIDAHQKDLFGHFQIGLELLIVNGFLTYIGLLFISKKSSQVVVE